MDLSLGRYEFLRIFIQGGQRQKCFGVGSFGEVGTGGQSFLHHVSSFIHLSQTISCPRQVVQDRRIICALADGFLQKAIGPREIAALIGDLSEHTGNLGIGWGELARLLRVSESLLLVTERSSVELRELSYRGGQLGIQLQRLLKSRGRLVRRALSFVSFPQTNLGKHIVRLLFSHRLEL